jgi:hypothetical protein
MICDLMQFAPLFEQLPTHLWTQHGHEHHRQTALVEIPTQEYNLGVAQWFPANCLGYDTGFLGGQFGNSERLQVPASINSHVKTNTMKPIRMNHN